MPYCNIIAVAPTGIEKTAEYLVDANHEHHKEYNLTPLRLRGAKSVEAFFARVRSAFDRAAARRVGRAPMNAALWIIVRTPDGTWLTEAEKAALEAAACEEAAHGEPPIAIMNWHENRSTGSADLNLLVCAFSQDGHLLRDRDTNPITSLRHRIDSVTDLLNRRRRERGDREIQTMREAQIGAWKSRGQFIIEEHLAAMPKPPRKAKELEGALRSLGCEVPRFDVDRDYFSVLKPTKAKRSRKRKARRYRISQTLEKVAEILRKKRLATRREMTSGRHQSFGTR